MPSSGNTIALIPLRGGSKGIPNKNIKPLAGRPLCHWVLEAACEVAELDRIIVSTDSQEIASIACEAHSRVEILMRPADLASDTASTESVLLHAIEHIKPQTLVTLQATSPLTTSSDIRKALRQFASNQLDSLLSAVRLRRFVWTPDGTPLNYDYRNRPRRQDFEGSYVENGAIYITRRSTLEESRCRLGGRIGIFEMSEATFVELDDVGDWTRVAPQLKETRSS